MSDQPTSNNNNNNRPPNNNNNRGANNNRRPQHNHNSNNQKPRPQGQNNGPGGNANGPQQRPTQNNAAASGGQNNNNPNRRRHHNRNNNNNRPRNPNQGSPSGPNPQNPQGINIERIYEKYLNLLDQHLIARKKYHDMFYRADPAQKNKLERNFYNTLNDIRDFESKLAPEAKTLFETRNNGLKADNIYTTNHEIAPVGENPPPAEEWADPHFLQSQKVADFNDDKEESVGTADDYLRYKNLL